ncbi:MAG: hypothetical protein ACRDJ5_03205 [Actinomycetota bacterium]
MEARRILIVANQTAGGEHLKEEVRRRIEEGPCTFKLLVPAAPPYDHVWTEGECIAIATKRRDEGIAGLRELGADIEGDIGDANPVQAIDDLLYGERFDEVILSTLAPGASRWLKQDLPHRVERRFKLPVTVITAAPDFTRV